MKKTLKVYTKKELDCQPIEIEVDRVELVTVTLFENGKRTGLHNPQIKERRDAQMAKLEQFGGAEYLLDNSEPTKYQVNFSEKVYELFSQKYRELKV